MNPSNSSHSDTFPARLADVLLNIEVELRRIGLWDASPPDLRALRSAQPFCYDTLTLAQWLQWICLPRMKRLLEEGGELLGKSEILPFAEESFRDMAPECGALLKYIGEFDTLINERSQG
ncbi:MAG: YqcC family protein [Pseudomonadota bacterium]|nr:MAG: YqcC family protein [Pseudomonadota bacterium]